MYADDEHTINVNETVSREMMDFIHRSPSCFHAIRNFCNLLRADGYEELREEMRWNLRPNGKYYTTRNDSSLIAFRIPAQPPQNFQLVAAHSDSPCFKIKENPDILTESHYVSLNTEKYGGMLCAPWLDRPLSVAGRAIVRAHGQLQSRLVNIDRDLLIIPNLAIHMDRKLNDGYSYNAQKDMIPLLGDETAKGSLSEMIAAQLRVSPEDIVSSDLFLYNRMPGTLLGANLEFIASPRLDDLQCAYCAVQGLIQACDPQSVAVCCIFDNEETGSSTKQGAASTFLPDVLERIRLCLGIDAEEYLTMLAQSMMISADNAHAVHPQHPDKADPTNRPYMNHGIVIKYNANQKYTTDAVSAALFQELCAQTRTPVQSYINRSDIAGGSTLGNIVNRRVSICTVDIGLAQLAMHSPYETAGTKDTLSLLIALSAFFGAKIRKMGSGWQLTTPQHTPVFLPSVPLDWHRLYHSES